MPMTDPGHRWYDELFIGGRWRKPATGRRLTVISPHSEQPVGECPEAGPRTSMLRSPPRDGPSTTAPGPD
ncbi:aldehyde dehydrogenase domain protein [Mycobacterium xenopi 3993]|nr:aldehyde dehydrogenase domain protein [Mycobacterium xenopi 3993]